MATLTIKQLFAPTVLTTAAATLFTNPASPATSTLKNGRMRFVNTSAAVVQITAYAVPSGMTAAAGNCFANAESISPNAHLDLDIPVLGPGDFIQALANVNTSVTALELDGVIFS